MKRRYSKIKDCCEGAEENLSNLKVTRQEIFRQRSDICRH